MTWPVMELNGKQRWWEPANRKTAPSNFRKWSTGFQKREPGRTALSELAKLRRFRPTLFSEFREDILFACWCAREYANRSDNPETVRRKFKETWEREITQQRNFARAILVFCDVHRKGSLDSFSDWITAIPSPDELENALNEYIGCLDFHLEKPVDRRHWLACLEFGRLLDDRRTPNDEARTGLAFELTLRFKYWTGGAHCRDPFGVVNKGLPPWGKPNFKLVARFLDAALSDTTIPVNTTLANKARKVAEDLRDLKRRHPDIKFIGWPIPG